MIIEIVRDFDNSYYANFDGETQQRVGNEAPEYVKYGELRRWIRDRLHVDIGTAASLKWEKLGRKMYAYPKIEAANGTGS